MSTLLGQWKRDRKCRGVDLNPGLYCLALNRWAGKPLLTLSFSLLYFLLSFFPSFLSSFLHSLSLSPPPVWYKLPNSLAQHSLQSDTLTWVELCLRSSSIRFHITGIHAGYIIQEALTLLGWPIHRLAGKVGQMAERLGTWAINQKVAGLIPGHAKLSCVLGQGTSPYLPRGNVPGLTVSHSG